MQVLFSFSLMELSVILDVHFGWYRNASTKYTETKAALIETKIIYKDGTGDCHLTELGEQIIRKLETSLL